MKISTNLLRKESLLGSAFLILLLFASFNVKAVTATIIGPSSVCPNQKYTFTSDVRNAFGSKITPDCGYTWWVLRNGIPIANSAGSSSFEYTFDNNLGPVEIRLHVATGLGCSAEDMAYKSVNISLKGPSYISGPISICAGTTVTYSTSIPNNFDNCYFHHKYVWTVPSGWTISSPNPNITGSITVTPPSTATSGTYVIKVKGWYDDANFYTPEKNLNVTLGPPNTSGVAIQGPSQVCSGANAYFYVNAIPGVINYQWGWPSGWTYLGGQGTRYLDLQAPYGSSFSGGQIVLFVSNSCGQTVTPLTKYVGQSNSCGYSYAVYPNPSTESFEVMVEDTNPEGDGDETGSMELVLFNDQQQKVKSLKTNKKKAKIMTSDLMNGIYYLQIIHDGKTEVKQIVIK